MEQSEKNAVLSELDSGFRNKNVVLFLGLGAKLEDLTEEFCALPWSCIVSSHRSELVGNAFATADRELTQYGLKDDLPFSLLNRRETPFIHLFGTEGQSLEDLLGFTGSIQKKALVREAVRTWEHLAINLTMNSCIVIVGYDPLQEDEFPVDELLMSLLLFHRCGMLYFFAGENATGLDELRQGVIDNGFQWYQGPFSDYLKIEFEEETVSIDLPSEQIVFYKGKKLASLDAAVQRRSKYFAELLNEASARLITGGKAHRRQWFYNFLHNSSQMPQWYGYVPNNGFYVQREYEECLTALVQSALKGQAPGSRNRNLPIILHGDAASSKSVELAALAYRIYREKINPVIFMHSERLRFTEYSEEFRRLDELMMCVERTGEKDTRILLLWDSAAYREIAEDADNLIRLLENRGRRFVLACTAYKQDVKYAQGKSMYRYDAEGTGAPFIQVSGCDESAGVDVYFDGFHYFIESTRHITDRERASLEYKIKEFAPDDLDLIMQRLKKMKDDDRQSDIFYWFYQLEQSLRPHLQRQLGLEQVIVDDYVAAQLALANDEEIPEETDIAAALRAAGFSLEPQEEQAASMEREAIKEKFNLAKFSTCVAMFSRFKEYAPYNLSVQMLVKEGQGAAWEQYGEEQRRILSILSSDMAYIPCISLPEGGQQAFRFRSPLEAELFLRNNQVTEERQVELVCDMLTCYIRSAMQYQSIDGQTYEALPGLLRLMGPNSKYSDFRVGGRSRQEHLHILKHLDQITEKLQEICGSPEWYDPEQIFAHLTVTFLREQYASMWDVLHKEDETEAAERSDLIKKRNLRLRMEKLEQAINLAQKAQDILQKRMQDSNADKRGVCRGNYNSLAVELAHCNEKVLQLRDDYMEIDPGADLSRFQALDYGDVYRSLRKAIRLDPQDGYAYNALFRAFLGDYQRLCDTKAFKVPGKDMPDLEDTKLNRLMEINAMVEEAKATEISSRGMNGKDELSMHIAKITEIYDNDRVYIEDLVDSDGSKRFLKLFDEMIRRRNPAAICYVAKSELLRAGLDDRAAQSNQDRADLEQCLSDEQRAVCRKIMDFMRRPEYESSINSNPYALHFLLRVAWMYYDGYPLSNYPEAKPTYINDEGWSVLDDLGKKYHQVADESQENMLVELVRALAAIQLDKQYAKAMKIIRQISRQEQNNWKWSPYLLCDMHGNPWKFSGRIDSNLLKHAQNSGIMRIYGLPEQFNRGRFHLRNLGMQRWETKRQDFKEELELALNYSGGFSVYTEKGRKGGRQ